MGARILLALLLVPLLAGCDILGGCTDEVVRAVTSPDGLHDAVLFQRSCGATTAFTTQISIVAHGAAPEGGGNVLIADGDHGKAADTLWHGPWAGIGWLAADRLLVVYDPDARVFSQSRTAEGVAVVFRRRRPAARAAAGA